MRQYVVDVAKTVRIRTVMWADSRDEAVAKAVPFVRDNESRTGTAGNAEYRVLDAAEVSS